MENKNLLSMTTDFIIGLSNYLVEVDYELRKEELMGLESFIEHLEFINKQIYDIRELKYNIERLKKKKDALGETINK